jgi:putative DNA primase/helicase
MSLDRARSALSFVSADDRDVWVRMAMAIKSEFGEDAYLVWDQWSQTSDSYRPDSAKAVWRSVKASGGVSCGTLFKTAIENGWRDDGEHHRATPAEMAELRLKAAQRASEEAKERTAEAFSAANKAARILARCELAKHAYFDAKGMPDRLGLVWPRDGMDPILCVPMRIGADLAGLQMISIHGDKKFLKGQRTKCAGFVIGSSGKDLYCEGYATGLSVSICMAALKIPARIHVCFSAGNLAHMARSGFVIADHDASGTGERSAKETGLPYYMPTNVGDDFNDEWLRVGTFKASQLLRGLFLKK